jgi:hypothetical protein
MLIGKDFEKIEWDFMGLHLLEPNAMIGDIIIFTVAISLAIQVHKNTKKNIFFSLWKWFFVIFGCGFLMGGFGHLFYNYWGLNGKYFSWYSGMFAALLIELAMISIYPKVEWRKKLQGIAYGKLVLSIAIATYIYATVDLVEDPSKGLIVPTLNSVVGLGLALGLLGYYYQRKLDSSFRFLWISTLILIPSAVIQSMKINVHQWFDRNDISHVLLITSIVFYYTAVKKYNSSLG